MRRTVWKAPPPTRYSITPLEVCSSPIAATTQGATSWRVSSSGTRRRAAKAASCPPTYRIVAAVSGFGDGTGRRLGGRGLGGGGVCRMCDGRGEGVSWRGAWVGEGRSDGLYRLGGGVCRMCDGRGGELEGGRGWRGAFGWALPVASLVEPGVLFPHGVNIRIPVGGVVWRGAEGVSAPWYVMVGCSRGLV